jgi:predicted phage replisome organizer
MSEIKKYYFLKLKDNFFDSGKIRALESMPNGIYYSNLLIKLYLKALEYDGVLKPSENMTYDEKMIAALTNLDIKFVRSGLPILAALGLIENLEDGTICMTDMQNFVGKSNNEADRKRIYRNKIHENKKTMGQISEKAQ